MPNIEIHQQTRGMQALNVTQPQNRYAVAGMNPITEEEIQGNPVAIRTLMLDHAAMAQHLEEARNLLKAREGELEYLRTSPFLNSFSLLVSLAGATVSSVGTNLVTSEKPPAYAWHLVYLGAFLVIVAGLANILHPAARRLFNRGREQPPLTGQDAK